MASHEEIDRKCAVSAQIAPTVRPMENLGLSTTDGILISLGKHRCTIPTYAVANQIGAEGLSVFFSDSAKKAHTSSRFR